MVDLSFVFNSRKAGYAIRIVKDKVKPAELSSLQKRINRIGTSLIAICSQIQTDQTERTERDKPGEWEKELDERVVSFISDETKGMEDLKPNLRNYELSRFSRWVLYQGSLGFMSRRVRLAFTVWREAERKIFTNVFVSLLWGLGVLILEANKEGRDDKSNLLLQVDSTFFLIPVDMCFLLAGCNKKA